ncbi:anti-phage ZorAB system protein ZorA [Nitrosomonas sp.]|uniref:anti-phage ZorAB system protein ZorA n=1 Tax=Nitrosomonas sp. TaxID=42353 RepID=UPI00374CF7EE
MAMIETLPLHIYVFGFFLLALLAYFLVSFCRHAYQVNRQLSDVINQIESLTISSAESQLQSLKSLFQNAGSLRHLWNEYSETLHKQSELDTKTAQTRITRIRSTMPAEIYFKTDIIVDTPLRTDFFKHLPGLFTGVGIIGTFYGLLTGLQAFKITSDQHVIQNSLNNLLHGVFEAFLVSAAAIILAMVVTLLEKLVVTHLYEKVEKLVQLLDGLFEAGAGEEYLARLVKASESADSQTKILKDALVGDLKQILTELSEKQIAASIAGNAELGDRIGASLEVGLREPLKDIAEAFKGVRSDQGTAVQSMLTNVMSAFSQQIKELFGDQIAGINNLQQQTVQALQAAVVNLEKMASNVETAGQRGASAMSDQLAESMASAEARQRIMNEKMAEFVDQIRQAISNSQSETQSSLQNTLSEISDRMGTVLDALSMQVQSATDSNRQQQESMAIESKRVVGEFGGQVDSVVEGVNRAVAEMKAAVDAMRSTTVDALSKLNSGADTLYIAASDFAKAGQGVTTSLDKSATVANQLSQAAGSVAAASTGLSGVLADYAATRDSVVQLVGSMQLIVEQARREASMTSDVLTTIDGATTKLVTAQQEADKYLSQVSEVIGVAHESFGAGMTKALGESNRDFHRALSESVKLLREGIQELEATFEAATTRR